MTLPRYDITVTDNQGNVVPGATVEVRLEVPGQPLASLYSDRASTSPIGNPLTTDGNGDAGFFCVSGFYQIAVTLGGHAKTRRYVGIGLAQGSEAVAEGLTQRVHTAAGTVTVETDDADIIVVRKTIGAATPASIPDPATTRRPVRIVDGKYDAATNNITITSRGTSKTIMGGTSYVIDSNGGSIKLTPLEDGSGWI
ncbi:hypothetical protein [Bradyrhizobium sp. CCBAU 11357]|uniref:hypothetical protein n=1 Tax=Bradyrhizobium sp. CCBAU 11357 TaxID=1630808 RepID=UPI00230228C7|nr:hypothetical protein [Bradyrhizobium sp. CCBAU 11357]MDA9499272.1 hypothetical protein [Bradyrhizobium sp. CCBAU 11357]